MILIIQWEFLESHTLSIKCARWDVELNTIADLRLKELYIEKKSSSFFCFSPKSGWPNNSISTSECQMFLCHDKLNAYHMILDNF